MSTQLPPKPTARQRIDQFGAVALGALLTRYGDPAGFDEARRICEVAWRIAKIMEDCRLEDGEPEYE